MMDEARENELLTLLWLENRCKISRRWRKDLTMEEATFIKKYDENFFCKIERNEEND